MTRPEINKYQCPQTTMQLESSKVSQGHIEIKFEGSFISMPSYPITPLLARKATIISDYSIDSLRDSRLMPYKLTLLMFFSQDLLFLLLIHIPYLSKTLRA